MIEKVDKGLCRPFHLDGFGVTPKPHSLRNAQKNRAATKKIDEVPENLKLEELCGQHVRREEARENHKF